MIELAFILLASPNETKLTTNLDVCEAYHCKMKQWLWVLVNLTVR